MDSFTSTGLTSLLVRAVGDIDPTLLDSLVRPDPMSRAIVPDGAKRSLIARVVARHGPGPLLRVGQYLHLADETPILAVLTGSPEPSVLAEKWMRLERYQHATHHTRIKPDGDSAWYCHRHGAEAAPTVGENCLIAGLLLGLLGAIGAEGGRLEFAGRTVAPARLTEAVLQPDETASAFRIAWSRDQIPSPAGAVPPAEHGPTAAARLADLLAGDIGRSWRLREAARSLAISERSLQRRLGVEGRSFSTVLRQARMRAATELLVGSAATLAEIGYCCGYADQAHFQRDFLRATNINPRTFRTVNVGNSGAMLQ
jgi:AraC-like DNA-binding protein